MAWHHSAINMQVTASFHRVRQTTAVLLVSNPFMSAYQIGCCVSHDWLHDEELAEGSLTLLSWRSGATQNDFHLTTDTDTQLATQTHDSTGVAGHIRLQ